MFIINPYIYSLVQGPAITDFYGSIQTSSLYYNVGPFWPNIVSGNINTASVSFVVGAIISPIQIDNNIYNFVDVFSESTGSQILTADNSIINYVDLIVT